MANRELNLAVAAETALSASLASAATSLTVDSSSGFPAVDFPVVIDPDIDGKREVVIVTNVSGTTWTVTRAQDGTSDVAHDSGAVVALTAVPALWSDLHDRVEAHTHSGGSDGAAVATGDLTGHTKAAHDAIGLSTSALTGHDKATHDALGLDHGSLSGKSDLADHTQYIHASAQVKNTGSQSITAGSETTLTLDDTDWSANCTLASDTLTVTYGGTYRVYSTLSANTSTTAASSGSFNLKVNGTTQITESVAFSDSLGSSVTIGSTGAYGEGVETLTLSDGDAITLTVLQTGGSGHNTSSVRLAVERVG